VLKGRRNDEYEDEIVGVCASVTDANGAAVKLWEPEAEN